MHATARLQTAHSPVPRSYTFSRSQELHFLPRTILSRASAQQEYTVKLIELIQLPELYQLYQLNSEMHMRNAAYDVDIYRFNLMNRGQETLQALCSA